jgi:hypothetical protein
MSLLSQYHYYTISQTLPGGSKWYWYLKNDKLSLVTLSGSEDVPDSCLFNFYQHPQNDGANLYHLKNIYAVSPYVRQKSYLTSDNSLSFKLPNNISQDKFYQPSKKQYWEVSAMKDNANAYLFLVPTSTHGNPSNRTINSFQSDDDNGPSRHLDVSDANKHVHGPVNDLNSINPFWNIKMHILTEK